MDEIEAIAEMISAGVLALTSSDLRFESREEVVQEVWSTMERVRREAILTEAKRTRSTPTDEMVLAELDLEIEDLQELRERMRERIALNS